MLSTKRILPLSILFFVLTGFLLMGSTARDDIYLSCWTAHSLVSWSNFLSYNHELLDGSSSFMHVILLAMINGVSGIPLQWVAWGLSIASGAVCIWVVRGLAYELSGDEAYSNLSAIFLSCSAWWIFWAFGSLETTLAGTLLTAWLWVYVRWLGRMKNLPLLVLLSFAWVWVRPEAFWISLIAIGTLVILNYLRIEKAFTYTTNTLIIPLILILMAWFANGFIHESATGYWYSQPVMSKMPGVYFNAFWAGFKYVIAQIFWQPGMWIWTIILVWLLIKIMPKYRENENRHYLVVISAILAGLGFAIVSGGDWMEGGRFLLPFIPLGWALFPVLFSKIRKKGWVPGLVFGMNILGLLLFLQIESTGTPFWCRQEPNPSFLMLETWSRPNLRDQEVIKHLESLIDDVAESKPPGKAVTLASGQAGMVPFYLKKKDVSSFEFIDVWGLSGRDFFPENRGRTYWKKDQSEWWGYEKMFAALSDRARAYPDIIFELDQNRSKSAVIEKHGYVAIFRGEGELENCGWFLDGKPVSNEWGIWIKMSTE